MACDMDDPIAAWRREAERLGRELLAQADRGGPARGDERRAEEIRSLLDLALLSEAVSCMHQWLEHYRLELTALPQRQRAMRPLLWERLADVVERTSAQDLLEHFWASLELLSPPPSPAGVAVPLLGVPILNGADHLERLLASLRCRIGTLALVDNSGGPGPVADLLARLERHGHPWVDRVCIARPFANLGVAASWNLILRSFPQAPFCLMLNHDVVLASGALELALQRIDPKCPQWLGLLDGPAAFSAFLITSLAWNRIGWFEQAFHPAYFEDLDYRERLAADPQIERISQGPWLAPMQLANPSCSATLAADDRLRQWNRASFQLNRLWYFSRRRLQDHPGGHWRRLWLTDWTVAAQLDAESFN